MKFVAYFSILPCAVIITACGGGANTASNPDTDNNAMLRFTNESELLNAFNRQQADTSVSAGTTANSAQDNLSERFSRTNTQEQGIDEADRVKYDGINLFVSTNRWESSTIHQEHAEVRILSTDPEGGTATPVAAITEHDENTYSQNLYLLEGPNAETEKLVWLKTEFNYEQMPNSGNLDGALTFLPGPITETQIVTLYDISDAATPEESWHFQTNASFRTSRKIGDKLYLVLQSQPRYWLFANNLEDANNSETLRTIRDLLPSYSTSDDPTERLLVNANECLVPNTDAPLNFNTISYLAVIDLKTQALDDAICLADWVNGIYVSDNNVYFGKNEFSDTFTMPSTTFHKFSFDQNKVSYEASGSVEGQLGWQNPEFRMSEYNDRLRVVTTDRTNGITHRLFTLEQNGVDLNVIARLPNATRPESIGKPDEGIQAVRFWGDRAYVVTFLQIDPLYVINLDNPTDPFIAGEIEIPGFSTYLRPLNERYLFSIGTSDENRGIKLSLYDLIDETNPRLVSEIIYEDSESFSEALFDFHALNFLPISDETTRIAIPVIDYAGARPETGMHMIDAINLTSNTAELIDLGAMPAIPAGETELSNRVWGGAPRARMHDDTLFFILHEHVWSGFWGEPQTVVGPQ